MLCSADFSEQCEVKVTSELGSVQVLNLFFYANTRYFKVSLFMYKTGFFHVIVEII